MKTDSLIETEADEKKRAVIREGLRLSYGAPGRLSRVVPSSGAVLSGQKIPPGVRIPHPTPPPHHLLTKTPPFQTVVSSSCYVYHSDPSTFADPHTFRPERWLASNPTDEPLQEMESKFMPFSRGSRSCTGMNLAYAELYLVIACLYRRFEISNGGTTEADMQWDDCGTPVTRGHLKVTVRESVE